MLRTLRNAKYITYSDQEYMKAVNAQHMYNSPITLTIDGSKYIIGAGSSDDVTLYKEGNSVHVLSSNSRLGYIGLETIDLSNKSISSVTFLQGGELECKENVCYKILDKSTKQQLKIIIENYS